MFSTPVAVLVVGPGDDFIKRTEMNLLYALWCLGVFFVCLFVLREQMTTGETNQNMTRSAAVQLGCLQSSLLYVPFSNMLQFCFPLLQNQ